MAIAQLSVREILPATPRAVIVRLDGAGYSLTYAPGQALRLFVPGRPSRSYSIASTPEETARNGYLELLVATDKGGGSGVDRLRPGAVVHVEGPIGGFQAADWEPSDRVVFIAGGTGIAPLRALLRHALSRPCRNVRVLYSARTPEELVYREELMALAEQGSIALRLRVTRAAPEEWSGLRGRISPDDLASTDADFAARFFICGPCAMVGAVRDQLLDRGVEPESICVDAGVAEVSLHEEVRPPTMILR